MDVTRSIKRWLADPTLRRWAIGWAVFLAAGLLVACVGAVVEGWITLGDAATLVVLSIPFGGLSWLVYMAITAEVFARREAGNDDEGGGEDR